jgi:phage shock protein PspC (stress-responsive transcriptional regulator)
MFTWQIQYVIGLSAFFIIMYIILEVILPNWPMPKRHR